MECVESLGLGLGYWGDVGRTGETEEAGEIATGILNHDFGVKVGEEGARVERPVVTEAVEQNTYQESDELRKSVRYTYRMAMA